MKGWNVWDAPFSLPPRPKKNVFPMFFFSFRVLLSIFGFPADLSAQAAVFPEGSFPGPSPAFLWSRLPRPPLSSLQTKLVLNAVLSLKSRGAL